MESVQHFSPTLAGPATEGTPFRAQDSPDQAENAEPQPEGDDPREAGDADTGCSRALDSLVAEENANAEFLIGLDGTPDDDILLFSSGADRPNDVRGMPMWHEEQLHLAEWQALQQLEYLFNLTLSVDAKNLAIEQLKAQKK